MLRLGRQLLMYKEHLKVPLELDSRDTSSDLEQILMCHVRLSTDITSKFGKITKL